MSPENMRNKRCPHFSGSIERDQWQEGGSVRWQITQPAIKCSKLTIKTLEQGSKLTIKAELKSSFEITLNRIDSSDFSKMIFE